jgi:D-glycero-alpha-D-manno-heptose-7-phosphate kinase
VQPYTGDFGGEVVNFAINQYIHSVMEKDSNGRIRVEYRSDIPTGSGLGTSGAMNVGLIATIAGGGKSPEDIAEMAFQFESLLENRGGRQDQWAAAHGGFNHLLFLGDEVEEMPFEPMKSAKNWLRKHFVIAYTGIEHKSGDIHSGVWERYDQGDQSVFSGLHLIRGAARLMANGLQGDRRELVVKALKDVCEGVDLLDPAIHGPFRDVISPLQEAGSVIAWKALGAGGGGSVGLLCSPTGVSAAVSAIEQAGWEVIEWDYDNQGMQVN